MERYFLNESEKNGMRRGSFHEREADRGVPRRPVRHPRANPKNKGNNRLFYVFFFWGGGGVLRSFASFDKEHGGLRYLLGPQ